MRSLTPWLAAACLAATAVQAAPAARSEAADRAAIERLHDEDVAATITNNADELKKLWDPDAVRLHAGGPPEVGLATIYADDSRRESANTGKTLSYAAHVKDVQIVGDWAIEWGVFEASFRPAADKPVQTLAGKQLRVLKRQPDGSWKFARVMTLIDPAN
jgi:ketosteroid isomerase-like protein